MYVKSFLCGERSGKEKTQGPRIDFQLQVKNSEDFFYFSDLLAGEETTDQDLKDLLELCALVLTELL